MDTEGDFAVVGAVELKDEHGKLLVEPVNGLVALLVDEELLGLPVVDSMELELEDLVEDVPAEV